MFNYASISIYPTTVSLEQAETYQLTVTISPTDATNTSVIWSSGNNTIATVDANGLVKAVAEGNATITVTTNDGSYRATCVVTVALTSVNEIDKSTSNIYPNPITGDYLYFKLNTPGNVQNIEILDAIGRLMFEKKEFNQTEISIDLLHLFPENFL